MPANDPSGKPDAGRSGKCEWCAGSGSYHVGAGNYWSCPICRDRRLHWIERQIIECRVRPLPPGWQEALDRDEELRRAS